MDHTVWFELKGVGSSVTHIKNLRNEFKFSK